MKRAVRTLTSALVAFAVLLSLGTGLQGCGKKDTTLEAAPPPRAGATPEVNASAYKRAPGRTMQQMTPVAKPN